MILWSTRTPAMCGCADLYKHIIYMVFLSIMLWGKCCWDPVLSQSGYNIQTLYVDVPNNVLMGAMEQIRHWRKCGIPEMLVLYLLRMWRLSLKTYPTNLIICGEGWLLSLFCCVLCLTCSKQTSAHLLGACLDKHWTHMLFPWILLDVSIIRHNVDVLFKTMCCMWQWSNSAIGGNAGFLDIL